jgi:guanosine-3',5'-bis(diphosphate) 3'-pyrophosphohydrolase
VLPKLGRHSRLDVLAGIARNEILVDDVVRALVPNAVLSEKVAEYRPRNRYDHGHGQDGWFNLAKVMGLKFRVAEPAGEDKAGAVREAVPLRGISHDMAVDFAHSGAVPGDRIVGVMLPSEGIKVFQIHSPKLRDYEDHPWIDVTWDINPDAPERFLAWIAVTARNEPGALAKIAAIIGNQDGNIDNLRMTDRAADFTRMLIELEVWELPHLNKIIAELRASPDVSDVDRIFDMEG